jgi:hypothetical protein
MATEFARIILADRPDLEEACYAVTGNAWPEFMHHDPVGNRHWGGLYRVFPEFQFGLVDMATGAVAGVGNSLPLAADLGQEALPDEGWDWAIAQGFADAAAGKSPTLACALSITLASEYKGRGLSRAMVLAMRGIAREHGFASLIAPVRPSQKSLYPLVDIDRYLQWRNPDGLPFDAWMRVHARLGARVVKACPRSMRVHGRVDEWEAWAGMRFPDSGRYVVPGALVPVEIDREADLGVYVEPNVWMLHPLAAGYRLP